MYNTICTLFIAYLYIISVSPIPIIRRRRVYTFNILYSFYNFFFLKMLYFQLLKYNSF